MGKPWIDHGLIVGRAWMILESRCKDNTKMILVFLGK